MPNRFVHTQHNGCGAGTGIASTRHPCTIRRPIIIRTTDTLTGSTAGLSEGDFAAVRISTADSAAVAISSVGSTVVDMSAGDSTVVDMPAVGFAAVAEDTPAVATGNGGKGITRDK
jgi:hypothetical protein